MIATAVMKPMPSNPVPARIKAPHGATSMTIEWSDGHVGQYPHEILRGYCPCATCQGHGGQVSFRPGGDLELRDIAPVGNYAITLTWGDGHSTGIYNFAYLRRLCRCPQCQANNPLPTSASASAQA